MEKRTIGKFIASLRKANGYTQADLAEILGVSNKTISSWETDNSTPDLSILPAIADLFNISIDELIRGEKNKVLDTNFELSQKSEKIRNSMIKSLKNNYTNKTYISIGVFLGALALMVPFIILNHLFTFVFLIIGVLLYIGGIIFSIITFNNAKNKINESEDNSEYLRFISKKKLLLQCLYSFFILSPLFCFLMNNNFKNNQDFKATEEDISNLNSNFKLKRNLYIIASIIVTIGVIVIVVLKSIPTAFFNSKYNINDEISNSYTLCIEKNNKVCYIDTNVNNINYRFEVLFNEDDKIINIPVGIYKFDIYYGSKDELDSIQDFEQYGFNIKYVNDKHQCIIYYDNQIVFEYNLKITNRGTAFYSVTNKRVYEFSNNKISYYDNTNENNNMNNTIVIIIMAEIIMSASMIIMYFSKRKDILV